MGERLNAAKDALGNAIETLRTTLSGSISEREMRELMTRLQFAQNALIQNEKKIWLKTKGGKEMLSEFYKASEKLLGAVEKLQDSDPACLDEVKASLGDVEINAKRLIEETRRRSMVVT